MTMPDVRIVFLGTGNAVNAERFQSAILVEADELRVLLDTGGGLELVRRLGDAGASVLDIGGHRIVYSGDTRPSTALTEAARGADLLIHEVGGLDAQADRVHLPGHSTAGEAGRIAAEAGVRALALTHIPPART